MTGAGEEVDDEGDTLTGVVPGLPVPPVQAAPTASTTAAITAAATRFILTYPRSADTHVAAGNFCRLHLGYTRGPA